MSAQRTRPPVSDSGAHTSNGVSADRLLTADDLAARWQVPKSWVYAQTRAGAVPTVRLGRYYRYRLDVIEAFERAGGGGHG